MVKEITGATPNSFLARLWRKILVNDGYITYINQYRNDYINNLIIASELSNTKVIINKTNLNNKINSENMTWKNLIFILRKILRIKDIKVTITITVDDELYSYTANGLSDDLLSVLWVGLLESLGYDGIKLEELLDNYIDSLPTKNNINKTNHKNKLVCEAMTWKNLYFLLEKIIKVTELTFMIKVKHSNNTYSTHKESSKLKGK